MTCESAWWKHSCELPAGHYGAHMATTPHANTDETILWIEEELQ